MYWPVFCFIITRPGSVGQGPGQNRSTGPDGQGPPRWLMGNRAGNSCAATLNSGGFRMAPGRVPTKGVHHDIKNSNAIQPVP